MNSILVPAILLAVTVLQEPLKFPQSLSRLLFPALHRSPRAGWTRSVHGDGLVGATLAVIWLFVHAGPVDHAQDGSSPASIYSFGLIGMLWRLGAV